MAFSPDGRRIVSGSGDKTLRLWDAKTGQPIGQPLDGHDGDVKSVAFSPDGSRIVSGGRGRHPAPLARAQGVAGRTLQETHPKHELQGMARVGVS